jgi:hypothetical protein
MVQFNDRYIRRPCCSRGSVSEEKLPAASPSFTAVVFSPCDRVLGPELCKTKASCKRMQATIWKLGVQDGRQKQDLKLVSRQFIQQRLAVWAAGRGPDPSLTAIVF